MSMISHYPTYHHQAPRLKVLNAMMGRIWRTEIENMLTTLNTQSRCLRDTYEFIRPRSPRREREFLQVCDRRRGDARLEQRTILTQVL